MNKQGGWNGLTVLILVAVFFAGGFFFRQDGELSANAQGPETNAGASASGPWQIIPPSLAARGTTMAEALKGGSVTHKLNTVTGNSWTFVYVDPRGKEKSSYWLPAPNFLLKLPK